jgi:hypothetical protein
VEGKAGLGPHAKRRADRSSCNPCNARRIPADVRAEPREKNRHFCRKAATADIDVVTHFVNQDQNREPNAETCSVERPVETHKRKKTEKELEFEESR